MFIIIITDLVDKNHLTAFVLAVIGLYSIYLGIKGLLKENKGD